MEAIQWLIASPFILCGWIIVGAIAGELARRFMGSQDQSFWADLILGILGAMFGGFIAGFLPIPLPASGLTGVITNLIIATAGAALLIAIRRMILRRK